MMRNIGSADKCSQIAQIKDEIDKMPKGIETEISKQGKGKSRGQNKAFLEFVFSTGFQNICSYDEVINVLDAVNEQKIITKDFLVFQNNKKQIYNVVLQSRQRNYFSYENRFAR